MMFDEVDKLIAKDGEEKIKVLYSRSMYGTDKKWMSKEQVGDFQYPCVYYIPLDKDPSLFYCNEKKDWFGVPKAIFCSGVYKSVDIVADVEGKYGMTQFCFGVVDTPENVVKIKEACRTPKFINLVNAFCISKTEINKNILRLFRKDFWKDFV